MNGYPGDPDPLAPIKGIANGLILAAAIWVAVLVVVLLIVGT